jgi:AraC-like DNA-binding protein
MAPMSKQSALLIAARARELTAPKVTFYYHRLERVREYVENNLQEQISLSDVASVACLDRSYFSSYFRSKVGVSFSVWLRTMRVLAAIDLFSIEDLTITETVLRTGFGSTRTLERAFRSVTGHPPRCFKNALKPEVHDARTPFAAPRSH